MAYGSAKPLLRTVGWAIASYLVAIAVHVAAGWDVDYSLRAAVLFVAGVLYTNLFEHAWHRYGMHSRRHDPRHAMHHRTFYGERFRTRDPDALREITTSPYIFPLLLATHYAGFALLFPVALAPAFFFGVVLHFVVYEVTHWYTHVADNGFDRVLAGIPGVRGLRAAQIHHHRLHHAEPQVNFNFNPPFAGDRLARVFRK